MKTKLAIVLTSVIVLLFIALIGICKRFEIMKSEKIRFETNYEALKLEGTNRALVERVIKSEFKAMFPDLLKIAKESGIKVRNIETVHNVYHKTVWDTVPVKAALEVDPLDDQQLMFLESMDCIDVEGYIDFEMSPIILTPENKEGIDLIFTKVEQNDTLTTFYFFERKLKKIFFIKLRIGKKRLWSETKSSCTAEIKSQTIRITKKGK